MTYTLKQAAEALDTAAQAIADWGAYTGEYFQNKHNLAGDIAAARKAADDARAALAAPAPQVQWDYNDDKVFVRKPGEEWREAKPSEIVSALLTQAPDGVRRDAERYRWMKREVKRIPPGWTYIGWDAAIDAAMKEQP